MTKVNKIIATKDDLKLFLAADKIALGRKGKRPRFDDLIWKYEIELRYSEFYRNNMVSKPLFKILYYLHMFKLKRLGLKCGFFIGLNSFGAGLSIAHIGPIVVNRHTKVGTNCRIHVGVNIGTQAGYGDLAPEFGDNVYIAPGAKIFGKIQIASGCVIGANAVVNKSVDEENVCVGGVPAKIISRKGRFELGPSENEKYEQLKSLFQE